MSPSMKDVKLSQQTSTTKGKSACSNRSIIAAAQGSQRMCAWWVLSTLSEKQKETEEECEVEKGKQKDRWTDSGRDGDKLTSGM